MARVVVNSYTIRTACSPPTTFSRRADPTSKYRDLITSLLGSADPSIPLSAFKLAQNASPDIPQAEPSSAPASNPDPDSDLFPVFSMMEESTQAPPPQIETETEPITRSSSTSTLAAASQTAQQVVNNLANLSALANASPSASLPQPRSVVLLHSLYKAGYRRWVFASLVQFGRMGALRRLGPWVQWTFVLDRLRAVQGRLGFPRCKAAAPIPYPFKKITFLFCANHSQTN